MDCIDIRMNGIDCEHVSHPLMRCNPEANLLDTKVQIAPGFSYACIPWGPNSLISAFDWDIVFMYVRSSHLPDRVYIEFRHQLTAVRAVIAEMAVETSTPQNSNKIWLPEHSFARHRLLFA